MQAINETDGAEPIPSVSPYGAIRSSGQSDLPQAYTSDVGARTHEVYVVYPVRWVVLFVFSMLSFTNAIIWISFASIIDATELYFAVDSLKVNFFSFAFIATFIPGAIAASRAVAKLGMRKSVLLFGTMQAAATWLRFAAVDGSGGRSRPGGYAMMLTGQLLCGIAQPIFLNMCSKLASVWFATDQRVIATTISSMSNAVGIAVGQILPAVFVSIDKAHGGAKGPVVGMQWHMLLQAILASVLAVLAAFFFADAPPTAPSKSESDLANAGLRRGGDQLGGSGANDALSADGDNAMSYMEEIKLLLCDWNFMLLTVGFSIGLAIFTSFSALIDQLVKPCGYSDQAGPMGATLIVAGMLGCVVVSPILDKTKKFRTVLRLGVTMSCVSLFVFLLVLERGRTAIVYVLMGCIGFFMVPMMPVALEMAAECTFPLPAHSSASVLMILAQFPSIGLMLLLTSLVDMKDFKACSKPWTKFFFAATASMFLALLSVYIFRGRNLRNEHELSLVHGLDTNPEDDPLAASASASSRSLSNVGAAGRSSVSSLGSHGETSVASASASSAGLARPLPATRISLLGEDQLDAEAGYPPQQQRQQQQQQQPARGAGAYVPPSPSPQPLAHGTPSAAAAGGFLRSEPAAVLGGPAHLGPTPGGPCRPPPRGSPSSRYPAPHSLPRASSAPRGRQPWRLRPDHSASTARPPLRGTCLRGSPGLTAPSTRCSGSRIPLAASPPCIRQAETSLFGCPSCPPTL